MPLSPAHHDINLRAAAARTDQPFAPNRVLVAETISLCEWDRVNSPRQCPDRVFGHWPAGGQIMSIALVVEQTESASTRTPATIACTIIRIICGSWSFIEGFNQPTYRGMRINGVRVATWSSSHGWSGDNRPDVVASMSMPLKSERIPPS